MPGTARTLTPPLLRDLLSGRACLAQDDEALLVRFVRDRDEAAFAALVARHGPLVLSTARAVLRHEQDAEDAFQATFLALARRAPAIRSGATLPAWLHRAAHRSAVRLGRAARRRHQIEVAAATRRPSGATEPPQAAAVHAALDRLPRPYRLAVVLCDLDGHTYAEAAARLGCTEAALRNRLARARARLRTTLGRDDLAALALPRLAVPPSLLRRASALALGRVVASPALVILARGAIKGGALLKITQATSGLIVLGAIVVRASPPQPGPGETPGPSLATAQAIREESALTVPGNAVPRPSQVKVPSQVIEGVVRDLETGRPLEGWEVRTMALAGWSQIKVETRTDAKGHYRLPGVEGPIWWVNFVPPPGQPYPHGHFQPQEQPKGAPLVLDIQARRTALLRGQITDKATGLPVHGSVCPLRFPDAPEVIGSPGFRTTDGWTWSVETDQDGRYELAIPFGRSLISISAADQGHYHAGQGAERLAGYDPKTRRVPIGPRNDPIPVKHWNSITAIEARPTDKFLSLDIQLEPKPEIELTILGPNGNDLDTAELQCDGPATRVPTPDPARWVLRDFAADGSTRLTVRHRGRKLAGSISLDVGAGTNQALPLSFWGEIRGRVVHPDGSPNVRNDVVAGPHFTARTPIEPYNALPRDQGHRLTLDKQGRFQVDGLVPGVHYGACIDEFDGTLVGDLFDDLTIAPGEIRDLGDIVVRPGQPLPRGL